MPHLQARFRDLLDQRGLDADPQVLSFAVDVARLLVRASNTEMGPPELSALDGVVADRTGLSEPIRAILLELALDPLYRAGLRSYELQAFGYRFGSRALEGLQGDNDDEMGLAEFTDAYGTEEALALLEGLFLVAAADGTVEPREARALEEAAALLGVDALLASVLFHRYDPRYQAGDLTFTLKGDRVTVGRGATNDAIIVDPQLDRHHCTFVRDADSWRVVAAGSGRPVLLDGAPVTSAPLEPSSKVRIGPWTLQVIGGVLKAYGHRRFTALTARGLTRHIGEVPLLEGVSFTLFAGEVVALVGPSGAGKTTLINAIAGIAPADSGEAQLDSRDFHAIIRGDPSAVGNVPQDDLVHPELRVEESLYYSGELRFPSGAPADAVRGAVDRVLSELGIEHIRQNRIGDAMKRGISGGQRKRVNLGQELLTRSTRVLFLDEPTSGLDPRSSHDIARQVRQLADDERIVFLVTHDLSPGILEQVDHMLVMVTGGRVAYFGPPAGANRFFGVKSPDLLFDRLADRPAEEWARAYRDSRDHRTYVVTRQHLVDRRQSGQQQPAEAASEGVGGARPWGQFTTLTRRYALIKARDRDGLGVLALQPLVLALAILLIFPVPTFRLIFMVSLSCLWFGMSSAVRELISDRTIWRRERRVGVGVTPYLLSKVLVLGVISALQCSLLCAIIYLAMDLGDYGFGVVALCGVGSLTGFVGVSLGLLMSASFSSTEAAVGTLPLLLIPQICFSSVLLSIRHMGEIAKMITWVTIERHSFDLMLKIGDTLDSPRDRVAGKFREDSIDGILYTLGLKGADLDDYGITTMPVLVGILGGFAVVFLVGSWIATWRRDRSV